MKRVLLIAAFLFTSVPMLLAQKITSQASQTMSLQLSDVIDIKFVSNGQNAGPELKLFFSDADDYYDGIESEEQMLRIRSNKDFTISVRAGNAGNMSTGNTIPSFIYIKVPENNTGGQLAGNFSSATYRKLTASDMILLEDGTKGDNQTFTVQYKAKPGTMVEPGIYAVDVVFTASRY